jgi:hypothetical protein
VFPAKNKPRLPLGDLSFDRPDRPSTVPWRRIAFALVAFFGSFPVKLAGAIFARMRQAIRL